jgi:hypothetical protein
VAKEKSEQEIFEDGKKLLDPTKKGFDAFPAEIPEKMLKAVDRPNVWLWRLEDM